MSGFSATWLALREPLDLAARNKEVEAAFFEVLPAEAPKILDLASGAGSTVAALAGEKPDIQWTLSDYDADLLSVAASRKYATRPASLQTREIDLAANLMELPFDGVDAVTTSAFLDLVSETFLTQLVEAIVLSGKPFLASLTYDGRTGFEPVAPLDQELRDAMNRDQQTDKGFGPALGPKAAEQAIALFEARGYRVISGTSDWIIGPQHEDFVAEFLPGWVGAGVKQGAQKSRADDWLKSRRSQIADGAFNMTVGHLDLAALPA
ncbi:class I SAM-dependent methyltransferase [Roseibium sp.]|uniref:class I SAM-dependent methyltransferase n=1 Tax=Roseibium sp. TaxID=1936156 RepID=UPI00391D5430